MFFPYKEMGSVESELKKLAAAELEKDKKADSGDVDTGVNEKNIDSGGK